MARYYVKKDEKWNVFSSIVDDFLYSDFMSFEELKALVIGEVVVEKLNDLETLLTNRPKLNTMPFSEAIEIIKRKDEPQTGVLFKGNLKEGYYKLIKTTNGWVLEGADIVYCGFSKGEPQTERLCDKCEYYKSGEICGHPSIGDPDMGGRGDTFSWIKETPEWCPLKPQTDCPWK